ncbi:hypothetical protein [Pseudomonas coronafaciens]|uniref:hypothetical protein n=1 Tax=Pseudomonas coronafaciens TaxID=53409 RepID=UPI000F00126A|nr:hypothetical protein [Pseudomonas coronafaciens]RMP24050.1 hypothetical protein ALQ25_200133 [Pseudomonas coronafaciens pv. atropurpurea]
MNVFSVLSDPDFPESLTEKRYHAATQRAFPYVQTLNDKSKSYALCPSCNNAVDLRNRLVESTQKKTLYAAHSMRDVHGLAKYNAQRYQDCPLANPSRLDKANPARQGSEACAVLKRFFLDNIDLIFSFLESSVGLKFPDYARKDMLNEFGANRGFEYKGVSTYNIPIAFAYLTEVRNLTGFEVFSADLISKIMTCNDFEIKESWGRQYIRRKERSASETGGKRSRLYMSFNDHKVGAEEPEKHSIFMVINETPDPDLPDVFQEIYRVKVTFNGTLFLQTCLRRQRLIHWARDALG